jgi:hypothetical protein
MLRPLKKAGAQHSLSPLEAKGGGDIGTTLKVVFGSDLSFGVRMIRFRCYPIHAPDIATQTVASPAAGRFHRFWKVLSLHETFRNSGINQKNSGNDQPENASLSR